MNGIARSTPATVAATVEDRGRIIDELLRRALRVSDPRSPTEIAGALRLRYGDQAAKLDQEATGLPVSGATPGMMLPAPPVTGPADGAGEREYRRVTDDLRSDLDALIDAPGNREWRPELLGWRAVISQELADGAAAARSGRDTAQRQRALLAIKRLAEYARTARLVALINAEMGHAFRRLAATLDDATAVLRVLIGEGLYRAGLADGGIIVGVPLTDLRQRRDTLVLSLRRLVDTLAEDSGDDDSGEGLSSYGSLLREIDRLGLPELKVYLREETLTRVLDTMVDDLSAALNEQDTDTLRELASTIGAEIGRFNQLYDVATALMGSPVEKEALLPEAPAPSSDLGRFAQALRLFADAFEDPRAGARFIDLAIPVAISVSQLDEVDADARRVLRNVVGLQAELARAADCHFDYGANDTRHLVEQLKIEMVLHYVGRAIDLYAEGTGYPDLGWGPEEKRAAVLGLLAKKLHDQLAPAAMAGAGSVSRRGAGTDAHLVKVLAQIADELSVALPEDPERTVLIKAILRELNHAEQDWARLAATLVPRCERTYRGQPLLLAGLDLLNYDRWADYHAPLKLPPRTRHPLSARGALVSMSGTQEKIAATLKKRLGADQDVVAEEPQVLGEPRARGRGKARVEPADVSELDGVSAGAGDDGVIDDLLALGLDAMTVLADIASNPEHGPHTWKEQLDALQHGDGLPGRHRRGWLALRERALQDPKLEPIVPHLDRVFDVDEKSGEPLARPRMSKGYRTEKQELLKQSMKTVLESRAAS